MGDISKRKGAYLPHWSRKGGIYFVTFRLIDSLPQKVLTAFEDQRKQMLSGREPLDSQAIERLDRLLDKGFGPTWLKQPEVAKIVISSLMHFDQSRYELHSYCIMPNHVHVVLQPQLGEELPSIVRSWKVYSARRANRMLSRKGAFWSREYFDRLIRSRKELNKAIEYVWLNPESAGSNDWPWRWKTGEAQPLVI